MSWASRRRFLYITGILLFFLITIGGPIAYKILEIPSTCFDGIQNQGETDVDKGGPCTLLDGRALLPSATLWARSFRVRDGSYSAVAYIENPNNDAGVERVSYHFGLYDADNILIATRDGETPIMPGTVTPVFESGIDTGYRQVVHTRFTLKDTPIWKHAVDDARFIEISDVQFAAVGTTTRATAHVTDNGITTLGNIPFVAVLFDVAGNALAASETVVWSIGPGATQQIVFTWPDTFASARRVDILPAIVPTPTLPRQK